MQRFALAHHVHLLEELGRQLLSSDALGKEEEVFVFYSSFAVAFVKFFNFGVDVCQLEVGDGLEPSWKSRVQFHFEGAELMVKEEVVDGKARLGVILVVSIRNDIPVILEILGVVDKGDSSFGHDEIIVLEDVVDEADYFDRAGVKGRVDILVAFQQAR